MQLYPTRSTFHVVVAGIGLITLGAAARLAPVIAFGGAMLLAVAFGRAVAECSVARLRAAGFEMVWSQPARVHRMLRGGSTVLRGELRNRGDETLSTSNLRAIASSMIEASVAPQALTLGPGARAFFDVTLRAQRVGRWGLHGIALEVRGTPLGAEGLFELPLLFANPIGVEVLPASLGTLVASPRGGRARRSADAGRAGTRAGAGDELRELRDHAPGDPFKRIAWKASARRGRLLVRETDRDEHDIVWLVLDSSVELWAGAPGAAPLDRMIDGVAATAMRHLRRGDSVGLVVAASRVGAWIDPANGPAQGFALADALVSAASVVDSDRSELSEADVARLVSEHARPLDPGSASDAARIDIDALAKRAERLRRHAPFSPRLPFAPTARDAALRQYLASFGIESPPRIDGEREAAEVNLAGVLERIAGERSRANVIHVWAPAPARPAALSASIAALRRQRRELRWTLPPFESGIGSERLQRSGTGARSIAHVVEQAVILRAQAARMRGERVLTRLGVRVVALQGWRRPWPLSPEART